MVFSYTQKMLNNKLALEHAAGNESMFPNSITFDGDEGAWTFQVDNFGAPLLTFDTPSLTNGCRLTIPIATGAFKFWEVKIVNRKPTVVERNIDISGRKLTIVTPVKQRRHTDFTDARFGIEALFADLSQVTDAAIDFNDTQEVAATTSLKAGLNTLIAQGLLDWSARYFEEKGRYPMMFGGARLPNIPDVYKLRPTACTYSVSVSRDSRNHYITGALNLLLQIDGEELTTADAAGIFDSPLPRSDDDEGVLVISSYAFSKKIVLPVLSESYSKNKAFKFSANHSNQGTQGEVRLLESVKEHKKDDVDITTERIEGEFVTGCYRVWQDLNANTEHWSGDIHTTSKGFFDMKFNITADGKLGVTQTELHHTEDHSSVWATRILGDIISLGFDEIGRNDREDDAEGKIENMHANVAQYVDEAIDVIVLPGGSTGIFKYSGIEIKKSVNGFANMFLYAKFQ